MLLHGRVPVAAYTSRLLRKSASGVPAALRGSMYYRKYASPRRFAAALPDGFSEQPAMASERICECPGLACLDRSSRLLTHCEIGTVEVVMRYGLGLDF